MRLFTFVFLFIHSIAFCQNINHATVSSKLIDQINEASDDFYPILIMLEEQVDFVTLVKEFDNKNMPVDQRATVVIQQLQQLADESQRDLIQVLENNPSIKSGSLRPFWIGNIIALEAKTDFIAQLSYRSDIQFIQLNAPLEIESVESCPALPAPNSIEPGLEVVGAPFMWNLGYTGNGLTAFTNDTGVDQYHPSFHTQYKGLYEDLSEVWFQYDSLNAQQEINAEPFDRNGHGTHVNGTILGLDRLTNDTIGVAFNAQWIGSHILGTYMTVDNIASFQWAINPDGDLGTTDDLPDVINNSWYDPGLDELDCISVYVPILEALEAAGVAVMFSAGNAGPQPMTITQPHNINVNLVNTFTVGALNGNVSSLPIASFSSRGPSHCDDVTGSLLIKPEVSAPGVSVRSARPNGMYNELSGTSMASPHVAGCYLLLKEAFPFLTAVQIKEALYYSAIDLGDPGEDNVFGMGVVNLENAYNYLLNEGHDPVSPYRENDVMLIDIQSSDAACANELSASIIVENAGTAPVNSITIEYGMENTSSIYEWTGMLLPAERTEITLPSIILPSGKQLVYVDLLQSNGVVDDRPFNNYFRKKVNVTDFPFLNATAQNEVVCLNGNTLLEAQADNATEIRWYNSPDATNPIFIGSPYKTEDLIENSTYYASATYVTKVGPDEVDVNDFFLNEADKSGVHFDAHTGLTIKSVLVYAETQGVRQIGLRSSQDAPLASKLQVLEEGYNRFLVDFEVPKGEDYRMVLLLGDGLLSNAGIGDFPYEAGGAITLTRGTDDPGADVLTMFYDWEIEYENPCERTPVTVEVTDFGVVPIPSFQTTSDTISINEEGGMITFTNTTNDTTLNYNWNFGDGNTSTEIDPDHVYEIPDIYTVYLTAINTQGCSYTIEKTITVLQEAPLSVSDLDGKDQRITIFPNPASDNLTVQIQNAIAQPVSIHLVNAQGQHVWSMEEEHTSFVNQNIDITPFAKGIYFIVLDSEEGRVIRKVVVE